MRRLLGFAGGGAVAAGLEGFVVFELGVVDGGDEGFERCVGLDQGQCAE
jgi:hypothetical protein